MDGVAGLRKTQKQRANASCAPEIAALENSTESRAARSSQLKAKGLGFRIQTFCCIEIRPASCTAMT
jgi:hypothetical protein